MDNFEGIFGYDSETYTYNGYSFYTRREPSHKIDYVNKTIEYKKFWKNPNADITNHPIIVYNNRLKVNRIKRIIVKIDSEHFQIRKILINAERQLKFLRNINKPLWNDYEKNIRYITIIRNDFINYHEKYVFLRDYYLKLPGYKKKYEKLLEANSSRNICFECFKCKDNLISKKNRRLCEPCNKKTENMNINIKRECPVCIETFSQKDMTATSCGNGHYICNSCYITLHSFTNKCPMCRGAL